jgi:hypothetical protein
MMVPSRSIFAGIVLALRKLWLGGLDSNQDSQIQNLESCQLDDLPAVVRDDFVVARGGSEFVLANPELKTINKNESQHLPGFGTATIHLLQIKRLSGLRQPARSGFSTVFFVCFELTAIISPLPVKRNSVSPHVIRFEKKLPTHTPN